MEKKDWMLKSKLRFIGCFMGTVEYFLEGQGGLVSRLTMSMNGILCGL